MGERLIPGRPGLQAERTDLSWTRTGLSALVNGGLLLPRHALQGPRTLQLLAAGTALVLALLSVEVARRRRVTLNRRHLPGRVSAGMPLLALGGGTAALGMIIAAAILIQ
jgi:uncharacterized membrane protein YidH (DUF202 family)